MAHVVILVLGVVLVLLEFLWKFKAGKGAFEFRRRILMNCKVTHGCNLKRIVHGFLNDAFIDSLDSGENLFHFFV